MANKRLQRQGQDMKYNDQQKSVKFKPRLRPQVTTRLEGPRLRL